MLFTKVDQFPHKTLKSPSEIILTTQEQKVKIKDTTTVFGSAEAIPLSCGNCVLG